MTQEQRILDHLKNHQTITTMEAMYEYGVMRLASRINDLRRAGMDILTETVPVVNRYGETCHIAQYRLMG